MERSRILGAGAWTAVGLAAAFAVVGATSNRHCASPTKASAANATTSAAQAPACCAQDAKAAPTVATVAPKAAKSTTAAAAKPAVRTSAGVNGLVIALDPESGELGMPSTAQMQELEAAQQLLPSDELNHSGAGLTAVYGPDGSVSINLQGRFQEFATVRLDASGKKAFGCTTDPRSIVDPTAPNSAPSGLEEK